MVNDNKEHADAAMVETKRSTSSGADWRTVIGVSVGVALMLGLFGWLIWDVAFDTEVREATGVVSSIRDGTDCTLIYLGQSPHGLGLVLDPGERAVLEEALLEAKPVRITYETGFYSGNCIGAFLGAAPLSATAAETDGSATAKEG